MKNFREIIILQDQTIKAMLAELAAQPSLWNQHRMRSDNNVHGEADDILLRCNDPDNASDWLESESYPAFYQLPAFRHTIFTLAYMLEATRIGRVIITRLRPGGVIAPHTDDRIIPNFCEYFNRYHIALSESPDCYFKCGDEVYVPKLGQVFWFNNALEHSVENCGDEPRLTLIIDLKKPTLRAFYGEEEAAQQPAPIETKKFLMDVKPSAINSEITYQREHLCQLKEEVKELSERHYKELALDQDKIPLDLNWEAYKRLEDALVYHFYTIRDQGQIIGYYGATIGPHLHYKSTMHAQTDLFWIDPAYRHLGIGREFFANIETLLRELSIKKVVCGAKATTNHQMFFESMGWHLSDYQFIKLL